MDKKSTNLKKKFVKYGAFSAAIAGLSAVNGQIVYTDVNPDMTLSGGNATYGIDMDDDGTLNFNLAQVFSSYYTSFNAINFGTPTSLQPDNSFVTTEEGGGHPDQLSLDDVISSANTFSINTATVISVDGAGVNCDPDAVHWCDGAVDGYVGVKIKIAGEDHFGWIRLDVSEDSTEVTIKDFAYNSVAGESILAGDVGDLNTVERAGVNQKISHAINNKNLILRSSNATVESIEVYNTLGQRVLNSEVINNQVSLNDLELGAYIVNAKTDKGTESFKIILK